MFAFQEISANKMTLHEHFTWKVKCFFLEKQNKKVKSNEKKLVIKKIKVAFPGFSRRNTSFEMLQETLKTVLFFIIIKCKMYALLIIILQQNISMKKAKKSVLFLIIIGFFLNRKP